MTAETDREASPDPRPDTAKTGGGGVGEPLGDGTPTPQEWAVLDDLRHGSGEVAVAGAKEDSQVMFDEGEDDTVFVRGLD